jgi:hypothetical protein
MSDTREKLIELICDGTLKTEICTTDTHLECETCKGDCGYCTILADHLIANDVRLETKQAIETSDKSKRWIPVTERLPERGKYILLSYDKNCRNPTRHAKNTMAVGRYDYGVFLVEGCSVNVTHWMPLPEPPKGE